MPFKKNLNLDCDDGCPRVYGFQSITSSKPNGFKKSC